MKKFPIYQVDAFASQLFKGNPAAVVVMDHWPKDTLLQQMAAENNLAETAFLIPEQDRYLIRWFTFFYEINLCGHATLASAWVIRHCLGHQSDEIHLYSHLSGDLSAKVAERVTIDLPACLAEQKSRDTQKFGGLAGPEHTGGLPVS